MTDFDETFEAELRQALRTQANRAETDDSVIPRARVSVRRRRGVQVVGGAAACVLAFVALNVVAVMVAEPRADPTELAEDLPDGLLTDVPEMRTEYWRGLAIDVPADWGYGLGPLGPQPFNRCGLGAVIDAAGRPLENSGASYEGDPSVPYVGRPVALSDDCTVADPEQPPLADYVWFGAGLEPGTVVWADQERVQVTEKVRGTTVTVATDDEALREAIFDSIRGGELCSSGLRVDGPIIHDPAPADAEPWAMNICVYDIDGNRAVLEYATVLESVRVYSNAIERRTGPPRDQCPTINYALSQAVLLELVDVEGRVVRQDAVNTFPGCGGIAVDAESLWELDTFGLTRDLVEPWVEKGVAAVVSGDPMLGLLGTPGPR